MSIPKKKVSPKEPPHVVAITENIKNGVKRLGATLRPETVVGIPEPENGKKVFSTVMQWLSILLILSVIYFLGKYASIKVPALNLYPYQIIILSFSFAFTWVYIFKWGSVKPFTCVTCMTGWFSLIIGYWCAGWWGFAYMPLGMTFAALYSEIRMRWL